MARYLIEIPHSDDAMECLRVIQIFLQTGSRFLTNVDWGCRDGEHKAWLMVDMETKDEARCILPPAFRPKAKIVGINKFTLQDVDNILQQHQA